MKLPKALSALHHRDFRVYWGGQAVSLTGTWMQQMAQSWVLAGLTANARDLGVAALIGSLPILLLSLKAGELADRLDKRRILIVSQLGMMTLAFTFAALIATGKLGIGHIFVMSGLLGVVTAFDLPASQALPPELVEPSEIGGAVALMQQVFHGARLVGPAIAGLLIARFGNVSAFVANGLSYFAVIWSLAVIQPREKRAGAARKRSQGGFREGLAYVRRDPVIGPLMLLAALTTGAVFPFIAVLMAYYVRHVMGTEDASVMGTMMSMSGLGSLLGATAILWGTASTRRYWLASGVLGVSMALAGLALFPRVGVTAPLAAVLAFSVSSLMGRVSQTVQERAPPELRGRVMGVFSMAFTGVMPFASLGISALSDRLGYPRVMELAAAVYLTLGLGLVVVAWRPLAAMHAPSAMPSTPPAPAPPLPEPPLPEPPSAGPQSPPA
jgi:MFS family permease